MYTKHFGLNKLPFENVPDPVFFFDEGDHARIHARIKDSLNAGRGLMVITGPIGSGKTTLSQMIISEFSKDIRLIWMAQPPETSSELFLFIAEELGLKPASAERTFVLRDIREALLNINAEGNKCLVIIDESHLMSDEIINGIRLLNNLEEGARKLIQILLLGQEELISIINRPEMEPFRQRIATMEIMGKLSGERIRHYISHRLHVAGGQPALLADTGWEALDLAFGTGNTPRVINSLCDKTLNAAFERKKTTVDVDDVYEAAQSMGLGKEIFHYKIALKQKEKKKIVPPANGSDSVIMPEIPDKTGVMPLSGPPAPAENLHIKSGPSRLTRKKPDIDSFNYDKDQNSLKKPIRFLLLSIAALLLSIFFYCQRSASSDLLTCLLDLIGF